MVAPEKKNKPLNIFLQTSGWSGGKEIRVEGNLGENGCE